MKLIDPDISLSGGKWQRVDASREVQRLYDGSFVFHGVLRAYDWSVTTNLLEETLPFEVIKENAGGSFATWKAKIFSDPSITLTPIIRLDVSGPQNTGLQVYQFLIESLPSAKRAKLFEAPLSENNAYATDMEFSADISLVLWDPLLLAETVKEAETKAQSGEFAAAYKLIFRRVDRAMKAGALDEIDSVLSNISAEDMTLETLIALLTATLPVRTRLPARKPLFLATEKVAKARNRWTQSLLSGLEG